MIKPGSRVLAIDDSPARGKHVKCIGVIARLNENKQRPEAILSFTVQRDGNDSTRQLVKAVRRSRWSGQLKAILTHSITLAGLNILNLPALSKAFHAPVIAVTRKPPGSRGAQRSIQSALLKTSGGKAKLKLIEAAGTASVFHSGWFHISGATPQLGSQLLGHFEGYPWPLRLAHLIAAGIVAGESKGRA